MKLGLGSEQGNKGQGEHGKAMGLKATGPEVMSPRQHSDKLLAFPYQGLSNTVSTLGTCPSTCSYSQLVSQSTPWTLCRVQRF